VNADYEAVANSAVEIARKKIGAPLPVVDCATDWRLAGDLRLSQAVGKESNAAKYIPTEQLRKMHYSKPNETKNMTRCTSICPSLMNHSNISLLP
jgi:hypothetical protein